ncbi:MAG: adenylate/guanylate cyclase domain-containing protein [Nocardioidaceae bacterium]
MTWYSREDAAERAGVEPHYVDHLVDLGIVAPAEPNRFSPGDVRRMAMAKSLEDAAIPLDHVVAALRSGALSLDFLDADAYERFATLAGETFQQVSDRTGVPLELLTAIREAIGSSQPSPDDLLREDEMAVVPFLELQVSAGFRPTAIEHLLRVHGESTRRMAEAEGAWWNSEVVAPAMAAGLGPKEMANAGLADISAPLAEQAVLGLYHAQQARAWTANIIDSFEVLMAKAGIHSRLERPPAICFLDITGYTRLTQERGDEAAADLAATLARLVQRGSVRNGGKPIKWLGDGVMFYFREPGTGVRAALEMVDELAAAELPPAHVGLHTGPVLFQQGDYFGQTVNVSARIADYARPGEVLVSQAVADATQENGIIFRDVGPAELKGVSGPMHLLRANLT